VREGSEVLEVREALVELVVKGALPDTVGMEAAATPEQKAA
jgi:hypothetical protein